LSLADVKILLVDDNQHMRTMLAEILRAVGARRIVQAEDGMEAMGLLRANPVDMIMTDLAMRPMDGIDFVRLLRNDEESPAPYCPVIMISGHTTQRRLFEARDAGVNEFLSKPITVRGVLHRINQIIEHPRPFVKCNDYFGPDRRRQENPAYRGPRRRSHEARLSTVLD